jgi:hypothetical protein
MATIIDDGKRMTKDADRAIRDVIKVGKRDVAVTIKKGKRIIHKTKL